MSLRVEGPRMVRLVGQGSRNGRAGWVVYREDGGDPSDPVFSSRSEALRYARELCGVQQVST